MKRMQIANGIILTVASLITAAGVVQADVAAGAQQSARVTDVAVTKRVFRLVRFDGGRMLHATGLDGADYQIVLRLQAAGEGVNLSGLRPGDHLRVDGAVRGGVILAHRLTVPGGLRSARVASQP